jgi:hypothetical protein
MKEVIKQIIKQTPFYYWWVRWRICKDLQEWARSGRTVPPHLIKQRTLLAYSKMYKLRVLVESGTYHGDMVEAMKHFFDRIYSIELDKDLYCKAKKRFRRASHIEIIHGDSGSVLKDVLGRVDQPGLFWLDSHYSGGETARAEKDTPIYEELNHILRNRDKPHVIVIDDAHMFGTDPAYRTIEELKQYIYSIRSNVEIFIWDDSIRITPKS